MGIEKNEILHFGPEVEGQRGKKSWVLHSEEAIFSDRRTRKESENQ